MLRVNHIERASLFHEIRYESGFQRRRPLPGAYAGQSARSISDLDDRHTFVFARLDALSTELGLNDLDLMTALDERACEIKGAPPAASALGWKHIGGEKNSHKDESGCLTTEDERRTTDEGWMTDSAASAGIGVVRLSALCLRLLNQTKPPDKLVTMTIT